MTKSKHVKMAIEIETGALVATKVILRPQKAARSFDAHEMDGGFTS